jgi:hypothetical protein
LNKNGAAARRPITTTRKMPKPIRIFFTIFLFAIFLKIFEGRCQNKGFYTRASTPQLMEKKRELFYNKL